MVEVHVSALDRFAALLTDATVSVPAGLANRDWDVTGWVLNEDGTAPLTALIDLLHLFVPRGDERPDRVGSVNPPGVVAQRPDNASCATTATMRTSTTSATTISAIRAPGPRSGA